MGRPHKFAGSRFTARTTLTRERVIELARASAAAVQGNAWDGHKEVRLTASAADGDTFAIHGALLHKPRQLDFRVSVADVEGGARREVTTQITWYVTTQSKIFLVVPFGTASMLGHHAYLEFAQDLARRVSAEDPAASVTILKGEQVLYATAGATSAGAPAAAAPVFPPAPPPGGRACAACSAVAHDDDVYCGQCGTPLAAAAPEPTTDGAVR